jgi:hypothetical protein
MSLASMNDEDKAKYENIFFNSYFKGGNVVQSWWRLGQNWQESRVLLVQVENTKLKFKEC